MLNSISLPFVAISEVENCLLILFYFYHEPLKNSSAFNCHSIIFVSQNYRILSCLEAAVHLHSKYAKYVGHDHLDHHRSDRLFAPCQLRLAKEIGKSELDDRLLLHGPSLSSDDTH